MVADYIDGIYPGDRLKDLETSQEYRVLQVFGNLVTVCLIDEPNHTRLVIKDFLKTDIRRMFNLGEMIKIDEPAEFFVLEHLGKSEREKYQKRLEFVQKLAATYGPSWKGLAGKGRKPEFEKACQDAYFNKRQGRIWINKYIQSGCRNSALLSKNNIGEKEIKERVGQKKNGRKVVPGNPDTGVPLTDYTIASFEMALDFFKHGPDGNKRNFHTATLTAAYRYMIGERYNELAVYGKGDPFLIVPENQRPSFRQFHYYCQKHLSKEERRKVKTSLREVRNGERLLPGDTVRDAQGPMDIVEIDAWEADAELVSSDNPNLVVGRPTVYAMIDCYSKMIVSVSVSFDRDSYVGLTNLFLSIADPIDKKLEDLGLSINYPVMPNSFLPNAVRTDNGSDFISDDFDAVLNKLNRIHETVPAATGSLKPNIERLWGRIRELTEKVLENHGAILKRNDNNSKRTAVLNIKEYTAIIYTAALGLNQREMENYPARPEMLTYVDEFGNPLRFRPDALWKYGIEHYLSPRTIQDKTQYYFDLMLQRTASLSRDGIVFSDLPYWPKNDDKELLKRLFDAGTKHEKISILCDPRSMNIIWFVDERNVKHTLVLNTNKTIAVDMKDKTLKECEQYQKQRRKNKAAVKSRNVVVDTAIQNTTQVITNLAIKSKTDINADSTNIRENHESEKIKTRHQNAIANRIDGLEELPTVSVPALPETTTDSSNDFDFDGDYTEYIKSLFNS